MTFKGKLPSFALKGSQRFFAFITTLLALSVFGCANLSDSRPYDFRKARWGISQEWVLHNNQDKRIHLKKENVIIFHHSFSDIPCKLVYCFKEGKLRAAGYITDTPVEGAENVVKLGVTELGEPTEIFGDEMIWITDSTLVYLDTSLSQVVIGEYRSSEGILSHLSTSQEPSGIWLGRWVYIDRNFYEELKDARLPLDQLSYYEHRLFRVSSIPSIATYYGNYLERHIIHGGNQ